MPQALVAQLTDTHIVAPGATYFGVNTAQYLRDAIDALHALPTLPDCVVVTGDLVNSGRVDEYVHFRDLMHYLRVPYFVVPGNHDDAGALRATLPAHTYGGSRDVRLRYTIDDFAVRLACLDANNPGSSPGASLDRETLRWLERAIGEVPEKPTIVCLHHPPFRTGLHYLDVFGFRGARALREVVERRPLVGRIICGHIHCVRERSWRGTLCCSAPSTAPQVVPLIFMDGKLFGMRRERPGFALHAWSPERGFTTTVIRRTEHGQYVA